MKRITIFDRNTGRIIRNGACPDKDIDIQTRAPNEAVFIGVQGNDLTELVQCDNFDIKGRPVNPRIVDKQKVAQ